MNACSHSDQPTFARVCSHLLEKKDGDYIRHFVGTGIAYDLLCAACALGPNATFSNEVDVCLECFREIEANGQWDGIFGTPEVIDRSSNLRFHHELLEISDLAGVNILEIRAIEASPGLWLALTSTGAIVEIDTGRRSARTLANIPEGTVEVITDGGRQSWLKGPRYILLVSSDGKMAAVANTYGWKGVVFNLITGQKTMDLVRDKGHEDVSSFPIAFARIDNRNLIIHATAWNRLDISDPYSGELLSSREPTSYKKGESKPTHYLDYFHCLLSVSPDQEYIVDNGWVWDPIGVMQSWNLFRWVRENPWESEDGTTKRTLCQRSYFWDGPLCWLDNCRLAVWGYGEDDEWLLPAVRIFNVESGVEERWFPGPKGSLVFDEYLFSIADSEGTTVWDVTTGERLLIESGFYPTAYHRSARYFVSILGDGGLRISSLQRD